MGLSHREKQRLFDSLARLVRAGITLPAALDKLAASASGEARRVIRSVRLGFAEGDHPAEAFRREARALGVMEASVLGAAERTGRMDEVLHHLSEYHGALGVAREQIRAKLLYPLFLLHVGVLVLSLPRLLPKSEFSTAPAGVEHGLQAYLSVTLGLFAAIYAAGFLMVVIARALSRVATRSSPIAALLGCIPVIGSIRRNFALGRFCLTYELHLSAGVNAPDALESAAEASQSGVIRSAIREVVPGVRRGAQAGELLAKGGSLPASLIEGLVVGEETGQLDQTLARLANGFRSDAMASLQTFAEWLPRILYLAVVAFLVWKLVQTWAQAYLGPLQQLIDSTAT